MATFPGGLPVLGTNNLVIDGTTKVQAKDINQINVEVDALCDKVGKNSSAVTASHDYKIAALEALHPLMATGSYVGTGAGKSITGVGFQPTFMIICVDDASHDPVLKIDTLTATYSHLFGTGWVNNAIISFDADGFTIGNHTDVSANGVTFSWVAFRTS